MGSWSGLSAERAFNTASLLGVLWRELWAQCDCVAVREDIRFLRLVLGYIGFIA